jgi:hypothetical protein
MRTFFMVRPAGLIHPEAEVFCILQAEGSVIGRQGEYRELLFVAPRSCKSDSCFRPSSLEMILLSMEGSAIELQGLEAESDVLR